MAISKIKEQDIMDALKYIDENGVPFHNQSTKYQLITEDGKKYPPKYVMAVAAYIGNVIAIMMEMLKELLTLQGTSQKTHR